MRDHLRDPRAILERSFALIRAEVPLGRFPPALHGLVLRLVHACGMPDIAGDLAWSGDVAVAGRAALAGGAPILADARMTAAGVPVETRLYRGATYDFFGLGAKVPEAATAEEDAARAMKAHFVRNEVPVLRGPVRRPVSRSRARR